MRNTPDVELLGPPKFNWLGSILLWIGAGILASFFLPGSAPPHRDSPFLVPAVVIAAASVLQFMIITGRDIVLSVEGVRKGKGPRSTFIPWRDATIRYDRKDNRFIVTAKRARIVFRDTNFADSLGFQQVMGHVRYTVYEQALRRNVHADKISTPIHGLSGKDKAEFLKYGGDGFLENVFWPYLALPTFIVCLADVGFIEVLMRRPRFTPLVTPYIHAILQAFPALFHGPVAFVIFLCALIGLLLTGGPGFSRLTQSRRFKEMRSRWLHLFERPQMVSISEIGLVCRDADGQRFYPWNDVCKISETRGLILFHLVPDLTLSIIVPKRIFATPQAAEDFRGKALDFKRAALTQPSLVEPLSFWQFGW